MHRRVLSRHAVIVGRVFSNTGITTGNRDQASHAHPQRGAPIADARSLSSIPLRPQPRRGVQGR